MANRLRTTSAVPSTARRVAAGSAALLLAGTLAACSGGARTSSGTASSVKGSSGGAGTGYSRPAADNAGGGSASKPSSATAPQTAARVLPSDRDVVYRGSISVQVADISAAVARAEDLATGADGVVFSEQTSFDPQHPRRGSAELTLRVPPTAFGPTLDALGRLGKELDRQRSAEDVTMQVTDIDSRVRSQRRSVERMRVLLARADTIGQVVQVESELARREADLESLEAQQARLEDLTSLATIQVRLATPERPAVPTARHKEQLGFLSGLRGGWDAFTGVVAVALTVVGALVPFAVTAALVGVPLLLVWRSRRRPVPTPSPTRDA